MNNNYKNNNGSNSNLQKINSFMSPLDRNLPNTSGNYQSKYDNYGYYQRKENNDNSSNSSFLCEKPTDLIQEVQVRDEEQGIIQIIIMIKR